MEEYVQMILDMDYDDRELGMLGGDRNTKADFIRQLLRLFDSKEQFGIDLATVAELMQRRIDVLKNALTKNFQQDIDYTISVVSTGGRGRPAEQLWLSTRTFKRLLMILRGPQAEALRGYFLIVEDAYRESRNEQISARQQKYPDTPVSPEGKRYQMGHCVYVIQVSTTTPQGDPLIKHKIGRTKNLNRRFPELRRLLGGAAVEVVHQRMVGEDVVIESCAHALLKLDRLDHEVEMFVSDIQLVLAAIDSCEAGYHHAQELFANAQSNSSRLQPSFS